MVCKFKVKVTVMIIMGNQSLSLLGFLGDLLGGFLGWSLGLLGGLLWGSLWCGLLGDFLCCGFGYRKDRLDIIHEKSWYWLCFKLPLVRV